MVALNYKSVLKAVCLSIVLGTSFGLSADNVVVKARMDSTAIWMGEQTVIHLEMVQDKGQTVMLPVIGDTLVSVVEVLKISKPDTTDLKNNRFQINNDVLVTSFDSGFYYIPPFKYILGKDTFKTNELSLKVVPVEVDTTAAEMDIKGVDSPEFVLWDFIPEWIWYVLVILILIAAGVFGYIYWKKHKIAPEAIDEKNLLPPHERALSALSALKESKLWQSGQEKEYYTKLTDILREYIDERFHVNAMEMTSSQIIDTLRRNDETKAVNQQLKEILEMADFVKFAKMRPLPDDNEMAMRRAVNFVDETKPEEPVISEIENKETAESKDSDGVSQVK